MQHEFTVHPPARLAWGGAWDTEHASKMHLTPYGVKLCDGKTLKARPGGWVVRHSQSPHDDGDTCLRCLRKFEAHRICDL